MVRALPKTRILQGLVLALGLLLLVRLFASLDQFQWDFKTYYYAGRAFRAGLNPYYLRSLSQMAGQEIGFYYAYPPSALLLFDGLSRLPFPLASRLFFLAKMIALVGLYLLWGRGFLPRGLESLFLAFTIFGFGGALYVDLVSGNVNLFEQLGIWLALWAFLRQRWRLFAIALALASFFKLWPLVLLILPVLGGGRRAKRAAAASFALAVGLQAPGFLLYPELGATFLRQLPQIDSRGPRNPSLLAFLRDLGDWGVGRWNGLPAWLPEAVFVLAVALILGITLKALRERRVGRRQMVTLLCLTLALVLPRFKDYTYVLLLLPTYLALVEWMPAVRGRFLLFLLMLSPTIPLPFGVGGLIWESLTRYWPLFTAALIWWGVLSSLAGSKKALARGVG